MRIINFRQKENKKFVSFQWRRDLLYINNVHQYCRKNFTIESDLKSTKWYRLDKLFGVKRSTSASHNNSRNKHKSNTLSISGTKDLKMWSQFGTDKASVCRLGMLAKHLNIKTKDKTETIFKQSKKFNNERKRGKASTWDKVKYKRPQSQFTSTETNGISNSILEQGFSNFGWITLDTITHQAKQWEKFFITQQSTEYIHSLATKVQPEPWELLKSNQKPPPSENVTNSTVKNNSIDYQLTNAGENAKLGMRYQWPSQLVHRSSFRSTANSIKITVRKVPITMNSFEYIESASKEVNSQDLPKEAATERTLQQKPLP